MVSTAVQNQYKPEVPMYTYLTLLVPKEWDKYKPNTRERPEISADDYSHAQKAEVRDCQI